MAVTDDAVRGAERVRGLLRVGPGPVDLTAVDPHATPGLPHGVSHADGPAWSRAEMARLGELLAAEQERLYATARVGGRRRMLVVLQAMDCGGKDGTIKNVIGTLNPMGVRITGFGPPSPHERTHPFLWRIRRALPEPGYVGVFNRSHYEDVLAARVRDLVPEPVWRARYDEINEFERGLVDDGVTLVKVMLHISAEEQRRRLLERLDDPTKRWKFNPADLDDRARWADYQAAYQDALTRCTAEQARWHVVPANRKWYRNWAVAQVMLAHWAQMGLSYPEVAFDVAEQRRRLDSADAAAPGPATAGPTGTR
jgi:PPK2 family polyphosphate:nucleotide phosphotransferase